MTNGKFISLKTVLWEIYRDTGHVEELNMADVAEWALDCIGLIYHPTSYLKVITGHKDRPNLEILNYRAKLPCDLVYLVGIAVDGFIALPSANMFHSLMDGSCCDISNLTSGISNGTFIDSFGNTFITNAGNRSRGSGVTYELNDDWLTLSVKEGKVCLAYLAIPTDLEGLPLVPDDTTFKEAIKRYVIMKIDYIKFRTNPSDNGYRILYEHSEKEYNWYIGSASAKLKMPDVNQMESIKRTLLRLKPNVNAYSSFFSTLNSPEARRFK